MKIHRSVNPPQLARKLPEGLNRGYVTEPGDFPIQDSKIKLPQLNYQVATAGYKVFQIVLCFLAIFSVSYAFMLLCFFLSLWARHGVVAITHITGPARMDK